MIEFVIHAGVDMKLNSKNCFDVASGNIKAIKCSTVSRSISSRSVERKFTLTSEKLQIIW
jgi:hypothetical protein